MVVLTSCIFCDFDGDPGGTPSGSGADRVDLIMGHGEDDYL